MTSTNADPTSPIVLPPPTTTTRKREAEEWILVLTAEGISSTLTRRGDAFGVEVAAGDASSAAEILSAWRSERAERAKRMATPPPRAATPFETAASYAFALVLLAFHLGLEFSTNRLEFLDAGRSQAALVLDGEVWRLATALTLHADLPHVLGNTLFGGFFLAAVAGRLGVGVGVLCFVATGTLGNLANAIYYGSAHSSVGASTGVFGLVGVLAGLAAWQRHRTATPGRGAWVAFAAGLAIVAMLGSGGPRVDFSAHLFGLAAGGVTGLLLARPFAFRARLSGIGQAVSAFSAISFVAVAWAFALG